jgi:hypothetical protein
VFILKNLKLFRMNTYEIASDKNSCKPL